MLNPCPLAEAKRRSKGAAKSFRLTHSGLRAESAFAAKIMSFSCQCRAAPSTWRVPRAVWEAWHGFAQSYPQPIQKVSATFIMAVRSAPIAIDRGQHGCWRIGY